MAYPKNLLSSLEELKISINNDRPDLSFEFGEPYKKRMENLWFLPVYLDDSRSLELVDAAEPYLAAIDNREGFMLVIVPLPTRTGADPRFY